jgi:hypothetical protein
MSAVSVAITGEAAAVEEARELQEAATPLALSSAPGFGPKSPGAS